MTHSVLAVTTAAAALVAASLAAPQARHQPPAARATDARAVNVTVSVVDQKGAPVTGLTAQDFTVREDNVEREVLKAGPATTPMDIALLVDTSEASTGAIPFIRDGVNAFIEAMAGQAQIAIITVGERPTQIASYTNSAETLKQAAGRLFPRSGTGAYLTEGIRDASRGLARRDAPRRAIVAVTIEAVEFSNLLASQVLEELEASRATLHVIGLGTTNPRLDDEMRNRNTVLVEGSDRTGGRRDTLLSPMGFPDRLRSLAAELSNQYELSYSRPEALIPPDRLSVSARRPGLTVRAPQRPPVVQR